MKLSTDGTQAFADFPGQDDWGKRGTNKAHTGYNGRRLVYGSVYFVIRGFGEVGLRNCRNAYHGAEQEQNEYPNSSSHRSPLLLTIAVQTSVVKGFRG
jgi:hypothetical protein